MIPQDVLSTTAVAANFKPPRNLVKQRLEDYALGGVAINNSTEGLEVYTWRGQYIDGAIVIDVPGKVAPVTLVTVDDVTDFQFTFDQNMQPFVCYMVSDTDAYFRWFDSTVPGFVTTQLPEGSFTPRCMLDDSRAITGVGNNDIILAYLRGDTLYIRAQKDRYGTEYELEDELGAYQMGQLGMSLTLRLQFQLVPKDPGRWDHLS